MSAPPFPPRSPRARVWALAALVALVLFARLGQGHLANYDDCFYAEKAKEMLRSGDWWTPRYAGRIQMDNPPLFLWLILLGFRLFGVGDYGALFFSALSGWLAVVLLVRLARRLGLDDFTAFAAGFVLATTQYFLKYSRHAMFDVFLAMLSVTAMLGLACALAGGRRGWVVIGIATGAGVLTKSVLGLFPLATVWVHRLWTRGVRAAFAPGMLAAAALALLVGGPWYAWHWMSYGERFVQDHLRWQLMSRTGATGSAALDPLGYVKELAQVYWPWLPFAVAGLAIEARRAFDRGLEPAARERARLLLLWPLLVLVVMSGARDQKLWYVMSAFPGLALLSASALAAWLRSPRARERAMDGALLALAAVAAVLALTPWGSPAPRRPDLQAMALAVRATVPPGEVLLNLDAGYSSTSNQLLFYSDHDLTYPLVDPARVRAGLDQGRWALIAAGRVRDVVGADSALYRVVARSGSWTLIKRAPMPTVTLPARDPFH